MTPHSPHSEGHTSELGHRGAVYMSVLIVPCHVGGWIFCRGNLPTRPLVDRLWLILWTSPTFSLPHSPKSHIRLSSGHFITPFAGPLLTPTCSVSGKHLLYSDLRFLVLSVIHYVITVRTTFNPVVLNFGCTLVSQEACKLQ